MISGGINHSGGSSGAELYDRNHLVYSVANSDEQLPGYRITIDEEQLD